MTIDRPLQGTSALQKAISSHQQGALHDAEALYRKILLDQPDQFDALHLLGVIARQHGKSAEAIALIRAALQIDPSQPAAYCNLGVALQDAQQLESAVEAFERALVLQPGYTIALNNLGNALRSMGRIEEATSRYRQAIACSPDCSKAYYHLGLALQVAADHVQALACLQQALALRSDDADAWCAAGVSLHALHRYALAIESYQRALRLRPNFAEALCNRGNAWQRLNALEQALADFDCTLVIRPEFARAHQCRGNTLRALGRRDDAIVAYRCAAGLGAEPLQIAYLLAALGAGPAPAVAPATYIRELFDEYADHFDRHLLGDLDYAVPALLDDAIARHRLPDQSLVVLDLGCGTGLCAPYCKKFSRTLIGVDLSSNMLAKADQLELYDQLHRAEATEFLGNQLATFDLIVAADVLVYFGDLTTLIAATARALRVGGLFVFSVEAADSGDVVLGSSHRYAHSLAYIHWLADTHALTLVEHTCCEVRRDGDVRVAAHLVVLRRNGAVSKL